MPLVLALSSAPHARTCELPGGAHRDEMGFETVVFGICRALSHSLVKNMIDEDRGDGVAAFWPVPDRVMSPMRHRGGLV